MIVQVQSLTWKRHLPASRIPSHRHLFPYATFIAAGSYCEAGESGRWMVEPGMVIVHAAGEAHADWMGNSTVRLTNFEVPLAMPAGVYRPADPHRFVQSIAMSPDELEILFEHMIRVEGEKDWPDLLARDLRANSKLTIGEWSSAHGLRRETVSRGFSLAYGVSPAEFRLGVRVKGVLQALFGRERRLADIAADEGFADQAHMTRSVRAATGRTPSQVRKITNVQDPRDSRR